jgi:hypothetical protein
LALSGLQLAELLLELAVAVLQLLVLARQLPDYILEPLDALGVILVPGLGQRVHRPGKTRHDGQRGRR